MKNKKKLCCVGALLLAAALCGACSNTPVILSDTAKPYGPVQFNVSVTEQSDETASDTPSVNGENDGSQAADTSAADSGSTETGDNTASSAAERSAGETTSSDTDDATDSQSTQSETDAHSTTTKAQTTPVPATTATKAQTTPAPATTTTKAQTTPATTMTKAQTTPAPATTTTKAQTTPAPATTTTKAQTTTTKAATTKPSTSTSSKYSLSSAQAMEQEVFKLVNEYRAKNGLKALTWDPNAYHAAQIRAKELFPNWGGHTRPDGTAFYSVYDELKVTNLRSMGENLAGGFSTAQEAFNQWINSEGHRANILAEKFDSIGIAMVYSPGTTYNYYWVQEFTAYFN